MTTFLIHPPVLKYILNGAGKQRVGVEVNDAHVLFTDLMLPGVILPEGGVDSFGELLIGHKCSLSLKGVK